MSVFDAVPMKPTDLVNVPTGADGVPHVTHQGEFRIGDIRLRCYQLRDVPLMDDNDRSPYSADWPNGNDHNEDSSPR